MPISFLPQKFSYRLKVVVSKEPHPIEYQQVFTNSYSLRDCAPRTAINGNRLVQIGSGTKKTPIVTLRLIEIRKGKIWHSYLTSVLVKLSHLVTKATRLQNRA